MTPPDSRSRGEQHGEQRHTSCRSYVAHEQAMHAQRRSHIATDLTDRMTLIGGELERKILAEPGGELALELETNPGAGTLCQMSRSCCTSC